MPAKASISVRVQSPFRGLAVIPDGDMMIDPKWYVIAASLAAFAMLAVYDMTLGLAAGFILAVIAAIWIGFAIWLAPGRGEPESERGAMMARFRKAAENRRLAVIKESRSKQ